MDMKEMREKHRKEVQQYKIDYWNKLQWFLDVCGFSNVDVVLTSTGERGILRIVAKSYESNDPSEIKFYPYTKKGEISKVASGRFSLYVWERDDENIIKQLREKITLAGGADHEAETKE